MPAGNADAATSLTFAAPAGADLAGAVATSPSFTRAMRLPGRALLPNGSDRMSRLRGRRARRIADETRTGGTALRSIRAFIVTGALALVITRPWTGAVSVSARAGLLVSSGWICARCQTK